jgi:hypothetical protein
MEVFRLLQVLVLDPSVVHGPTRRHLIGSVTLASAASDLLSIFEIPIHLSLSRKFSVEEIKNSFRSSEACADIWKTMHTVARYGRDSFDHTVVYPHYRSLIGMLDVEPWAFTCLFLLIFPTGNAIAERGFSAMGATHTKTRSGLSHEQVWANMMVQFNGPSLPVYAEMLDSEYASLIAAAKIGDVERRILSDLGYPQPPTLILCDNECAVGLAQRIMVPKLSKSIDMRFHWIQDRIKQLQFLVQHVAGANNVADFFTKSLPRAKHDQLAPYCAYDPVAAVV